jgi:hypothetical protein
MSIATNQKTLLEPDRNQLEQFTDAIFRHCWGQDGFISLRGFTQDNEAVLIEGIPVTAGFKFLVDAAEDKARRAANEVQKIVFCPPLALLNNKAKARELDLLAGPVLSVECDTHPKEARQKLEAILGPATVVVESGGEWVSPDGESQKKLHLHWRLDQLATGVVGLQTLKHARQVAHRIVGGDTTNVPLVHPIRWPGSWHRKGEPVLCRIVELNPDVEIGLDDALAKLSAGAPQREQKTNGHSNGHDHKERVDWAAMVQSILEGKDLHQSTLRLAASYIGSGMAYDQIVRQLEALMLASKAPHDERWKARFDNLGRLVRDGFEKFGDKDTSKNSRAQVAENNEKELSLDDFYCYMAMPNAYIFRPTREIWPATSVNARVAPVPTGRKNDEGEDEEITASRWIARGRPVEQLTWAPGLPELIKDRIISDGGWINRVGSDCYNQYRAPNIELGDASKAGPWLDHIGLVFPDDADHLVKWFAHRVQTPGDKINHALVLGGAQGIGKDTLLEPVKRAIGPWNWQEVSPQAIQGEFNGYLKSVVLRISEARDLGDVSRYHFYDHMKSYTAAPPDVLRVNEKYLREHSVLNCTGVIITTNHKSDGISLPQDDRRHYVAWSEKNRTEFSEDYWRNLWGWYETGGFGHVSAYLAQLDLSSFDPKAPPPKTNAFWEIVAANQAPEESELADVIERLGNPDALTISQLHAKADFELQIWLNDRKNRRSIPHRLESCGYSAVPNKDAKDKLWKVLGARQTVYAKNDMSVRDRIAAVRRVSSGS